jgi:hypothetical protein
MWIVKVALDMPGRHPTRLNDTVTPQMSATDRVSKAACRRHDTLLCGLHLAPHLAFVTGTRKLMSKLVKRMVISTHIDETCHIPLHRLKLRLAPEVQCSVWHGKCNVWTGTMLRLHHADAAAQRYLKDLAASVTAHRTH